MEKLVLPDSIVVFGVQVKEFPIGIGEAFDKLANEIPDGRYRSWYGISWLAENGSITYYTVAGERFPGESALYNFTIMEIEKGEYFTVAVKEWQSKTGMIKDVFHEMMQAGETDNKKPCIEWYKSHDEMLCMMKTV